MIQTVPLAAMVNAQSPVTAQLVSESPVVPFNLDCRESSVVGRSDSSQSIRNHYEVFISYVWASDRCAPTHPHPPRPTTPELLRVTAASLSRVRRACAMGKGG